MVNPFAAAEAGTERSWPLAFVRVAFPLCVVFAVVTGVVRMPSAAEGRWDEAMRAQARAGAVHAETLARLGGMESDVDKADALESGPLPLWSEAVAVAEELEQDGAGERPVFDVIAHARARETATRLLILAFREGDEDTLKRAEATWASADRLLAKVKAATDRSNRGRD